MLDFTPADDATDCLRNAEGGYYDENFYPVLNFVSEGY